MSTLIHRTDPPISVLLVEDEPLFRDLLQRAFASSKGLKVWKDFARGEDAVRALASLGDSNPRERIGAAVVDIQLGEGRSGIQAAYRMRNLKPDLGILFLSNHRMPAYLSMLDAFENRGISYLLKTTVDDFETLERAIVATANGGVVVDEALLAQGDHRGGVLSRLTQRQREILHLAAQGYSNGAVAERLWLSVRTVENHLARIYRELGIEGDERVQPRVQAVVTYLQQLFPIQVGELHGLLEEPGKEPRSPRETGRDIGA